MRLSAPVLLTSWLEFRCNSSTIALLPEATDVNLESLNMSMMQNIEQ